MPFTPVAVILLVSTRLSLLAAPWFIRKMKEKGHMVTDYYKPGKTPVAYSMYLLTPGF